MNAKGIRRKPSPTKKRNLSTHLVNGKQPTQNPRLVDHNHDNETESMINEDEKSKYYVSGLNSTKRVVKKLEQLKNLTVKPPTSIAELSPRTKVIVTEKALKKLNIVPDKSVFKHLPPVNVNDSILGVNRKIRKDKKTAALSTVDQNPTLERFLKPSAVLEYRLELSDSSDDETMTSKPPPFKDNFHRLYDSYRQYFDLSSHPKSKIG